MAMVSNLSEGHPNCPFEKTEIEIGHVASRSPVQEFYSYLWSEDGNVFGSVLVIGQEHQMGARLVIPLLSEHPCLEASH